MDSSLPVRIISASEPDDAMPQSIDETGIRRLVHGFYDAIRRDPLLGPIFGQAIAPERWPGHLEKMCAFWSSVLLKTRRYDGRPLPPHLALADLSDIHFQRWLELFRSTAGEVSTQTALRSLFPGRSESRIASGSPCPFTAAKTRQR